MISRSSASDGTGKSLDDLDHMQDGTMKGLDEGVDARLAGEAGERAYGAVLILVIFIIPNQHLVGTETSHSPVTEFTHVLIRTGKQRSILSQRIGNDTTGRLYIQIVVACRKQKHAGHYHQTYCFLHFLSAFEVRNSSSN